MTTHPAAAPPAVFHVAVDRPDRAGGLVVAALLVLIGRYLGTARPEVHLLPDDGGPAADTGRAARRLAVELRPGLGGAELLDQVTRRLSRAEPPSHPDTGPAGRGGELAWAAMGATAVWRGTGTAAEPVAVPPGYGRLVVLRETEGGGTAVSVGGTSPALGRRVAADLRTLVDALARSPHAPVADLARPADPPPYRPGPLHRAARDHTPFPPEAVATSIPGRFAQQALRHPDRPAVITPDRTIGYAELARRAGGIAAAVLDRAGRGAGRVALLVEHGPDMIAAILGTLLAGKAYVPLDPRHPPARLGAMLAHAEPELLLSTASLRDRHARLTGGGVPVLDLGDLADAEIGAAPPAAPEAAAYVLYTSGSTGRPKGVLQTHRNVLFQIRNHTDNLRISGRDRLSLLSSFGFDMAVTDLFAALLNGAAVVPVDVRRLAGGGLADVLRATGVTVYHSTPTLYRHLVDGAGGPDAFPDVRAVVLGGEQLTRRDLDAFRRHFRPDSVLVNGYGATEVSFAVQHHVPGRLLGEAAEGVPIGRALDGFEVRLLSDEGRPAWLAGEVAVRGEHLSPGYWKAGPEDAARFTVDDGVRVYRTGDLARRGPDGLLYYAGRRDHQVKIRGHRVEPSEVERTLEELGCVVEAVVVAEEPDRQRLRGYVRTHRPPPDLAELLRRHTAERLPDYMVPAGFVEVDAFPLTATGKVDRRALAARAPTEPQEHERAAAGEAPRSANERYVAGLWQEILGRTGVRRDDDLIAMGGHSLTAIRLAAWIHRDTGTAVTGVELLRRPTVRAQAALLDERSAAAPPRAEPGGARPAARPDGLLPASPAQRGLWVLHQLYPYCTAYHVAGCYEIEGAVDGGALHRALNQVAARHPALRTTFETHGGEVWQRVHDAGEVPVRSADLTALPEQERFQAAGRAIAEELRRPMRLDRGPLFRAVRYRLGPRRHVLLVIGHHLVMDGWSRELVQRDLGAAYAAGGEAAWAAAVPGFAEVMDAAGAGRPPLRRSLAFWREHLSDPPPPVLLPVPPVRPARPRFRGDRVGCRLDAETTAGLRALAVAEGVPIFQVLAGAFAATVGGYGDRREVLLGMPVAGRDDLRTEPVVGFFNNSVVARCATDPALPYRRLIRRTGEAILAALEHAHVPFEELVRELAPPRTPGVNPIYQIWCNMLSYDTMPLTLPGCRVRRFDPPVTGALFDLSLYLTDRDGTIDAALVYDTDLFDREQALAIAAQYEAALRTVARDPDATPAGRRLADPAVAPARFPAAAAESVPERFAAAAAARPEAPALRHGGAETGYRALSAEVARFSESLTRAGLDGRTVLAVLTRRRPELAAAVLGSLAAEVPFLLLDAELPVARLAALVREAAAPAAVDLTGGSRAAGELAAALGDGVAWLGPGSGPAPSGRPPLPEPAAYLAFTSGSTGRPQGVLGTEPPLRVFFDWYAREFGLGGGDRFSLLAGIGHDPLLRELVLPLTIGAAVCVPPADAVAVPHRLLSWLAEQEVTVVHLTPAMLRMLGAAAALDGRTLPAVRLVASGGAAVRRDDRTTARRLFPNARVLSVYGTTETPQGVSVVDLAEEFAGPAREDLSPLGAGTPHAQLMVLGRDGAPVPANGVGELAVRSPYLAAGYLNARAEQAGRFRPDPYGAAGVRLYRTGDRARLRPDGRLDFLGRGDRQLSVNGHRVEPAEIERTALAEPRIGDCVVDGDASELVAYVAPADGQAVTSADVGRHLAANLPPVMVPDRIVVLDRIPVTERGKPDLDRLRRLRRREAASPATQDAVTETLAQIWRSVLGLAEVGVDDNFFDLGGRSLTLLKVHTRLRDSLRRDVELLDLFRHPTIRRLAAALTAAEEG
ncbi:non-ribosomal peptide synthetase [Allonocardiopsis opalescens]|uniref:Amino acid adenylation domain-containing protein n=1 Tax=Allonocardiopsis opalescens TaxID=1144618 RepID=A0A2T0PYH5_9ACTN|nr:non-ribosomal peptide synthetase [Allonocardiopsis opalescens]PRX96574.1 amino acid adenylation domain-containing protein [Allonocardiopsis opalescens]